MTGEAQGISEQARGIAQRIIGWCNSGDSATILGSLVSELVQVCHDYRNPLDAERIQSEWVSRGEELAELRAKIAEQVKRFDGISVTDNANYFRVLARDIADQLAALASSGSAPTGQEER
jgi:hypothetical protein